jgi:isopentenyl diphosphate isomerase/L-lactate dehydrogenase-like FMN-dependent dehydrogenase
VCVAPCILTMGPHVAVLVSLCVVQGEDGVYHALELLKKEFEMCMQLMGCTRLAEIQRSMICHALSYQSKL